MKPPLLRSMTFWSGILVMAFIGWGWADSYHHRSYMSRGPAGLSQSSSYICVQYIPILNFTAADRVRSAPDHHVFELLPPPFVARGKSGGLDPPALPETFRAETERNLRFLPRDSWVVCIPHWLILLTVALPWSGLIYWRHRRIRMLAILFPAAPPP